MKQSKYLTKLLVILCLLLIISNIYFVMSDYFRRKNDLLLISDLQQKIVDLEKNLIIDPQAFIAKANEVGAMMPLFYYYFPKHVIYWTSTDQFIVEPMDESLPANQFDWSKLYRDDKNRIQFDDGTTKAKFGIDVSIWQGKIDWEAVKADGVEFAIIRLGYRGYTEGKIYEDDRASYNLAEASKVMPIGVYFFSGAINEEEAIEEANYVLQMIKGYPIDYPVVFDMEEHSDPKDRGAKLTSEQRTAITIAFMETIKKAGYTPAVYGNMRWLNERLQWNKIYQYEVWLAQYFNSPILPYQFSMWQYTSSGRINGIKGNVDLNLSFKDYSKN
jgi:lysozyme